MNALPGQIPGPSSQTSVFSHILALKFFNTWLDLWYPQTSVLYVVSRLSSYPLWEESSDFSETEIIKPVFKGLIYQAEEIKVHPLGIE